MVSNPEVICPGSKREGQVTYTRTVCWRAFDTSRLVWSGSGLKSALWMENAHFVEVERHPLYTRVREIFLKRERELAVTVHCQLGRGSEP